jgi:anti-sigma factor ChrR (cupin superfamily)
MTERKTPPVLDPQLVTAITAAQSAHGVEPHLAQRIKSKLMARIATENSHLTVQPDEAHWRPFASGIQIKVLHHDAAKGVLSYYLRLAAGAQLPAHQHPMDEECVVLEGELVIGDLHVPAGGFHMARRGVAHAPIRAPRGATIFLRGAVPEASHLLA